jgi:hypothetical protein
MLFNILKITTLLCASSAFVKAAALEDTSDVVTREDDALSQLADQIIALHPAAYNVSTTALLETRSDLFVNCGCAKSGIKYWHADMDTVKRLLSSAQRSRCLPSSLLISQPA